MSRTPFVDSPLPVARSRAVCRSVGLAALLVLATACAEAEVDTDFGRDVGRTDDAGGGDAADDAGETTAEAADVGADEGAGEVPVDVAADDAAEEVDAGPGRLVISEIDYDQPGGDTQEFLELHNPGGTAVPCTGLQIRFINGSIGSQYALHFLACSSIGPGEFYLVGDAAAVGAVDCPGEEVMIAERIENGPDALQLVRVDGSIVTYLDQVAYAGEISGFGEGSPAPADPDTESGLSIQRNPAGQDTDDNGADFHVLPRTPCAPPE